MTICGYDLIALTKRTVSETLDDNLMGLAAETAWSAFFGLFPAILFALPILSLVGDQQEIIGTIMQYISPSLPSDAMSLVGKVINDIISTKSAPGLISIGLLLALWSGSSIFTSLMTALNRAYDVSESRSWWKQRLIGVACMLGGVVVIWCATIIMVGGKQIVDFATWVLRLSAFQAEVWAVIQYVLAFVLVVAFLWLLYLVLPNAKPNKKTSVVGALFATVAWTVFTIGFRLYVQNFGAYNKSYGVIGGVMVLLTWMYWTMFVVLVGGELNSELEQQQLSQPRQ